MLTSSMRRTLLGLVYTLVVNIFDFCVDDVMRFLITVGHDHDTSGVGKPTKIVPKSTQSFLLAKYG